MVLRGLSEEREPIPAPKFMATSPRRSDRLHNFPLPFLKWGSQRYLRCTNAAAGTSTSASAGSSGSGDRRSPRSNSNESTETRNQTENPARGTKRRFVGGGYDDDDDNEDGIAVVRQKLMLDLKTAADKMKDAILRNEEEQEAEVRVPSEDMRPWNLRTRLAECKAPVAASAEKKRGCISPARNDGAVNLPKLRSASEKTTRREKFSVQLSRKEIEDDFMKMMGHRPPRKPNKRPKAVQRQMDTLFPGLWLTEITADSYKVLEPTEKGKGKGKGKDAFI